MLDAPFVFELMNSPGWLEFIGDRGVDTVEKAEAYIEDRYLKYENGLGNFLVTLSSSAIPIGTCGLYQRDNLDHPDLGFAFHPDFMGKGYAFEAASAIMEYATESLKLEKVLAFTLPENERSINLLKKLGFKQEGPYRLADDSEELLLFSR